MKIDLKKYMENRDRVKQQSQAPGPVITISREHGCSATPIAHKIIHRLDELHQSKQSWKYINRQVLEEAAKDLHVSTQKIKTVMNPGPESVVDELLSSFTQHYITSGAVIDSLSEVMGHYIKEGNVVIVGRGGAYFSKKVPKSLHIKLMAPLEWRAQEISKKRSVSLEEARMICLDTDRKRVIWNNQMSRGHYDDSIYDMIINRKTIDEEGIVDIILMELQNRHVIELPDKISETV